MHSKVDLDTVKHASEFVALQGDADFLVQNLIWSGTKLLNSCDDKLRTKIEEKTLDWLVQYTTGPVYFKIMIDNILASTPESMHGLTMILQETKLSDYNGENVTEYISFARGAIEQLRNNHALPTDVLWLISKALRTCETPEFVSYLTTMYNTHVQHVKTCTVDDMMLAAETEYVSMVSAKLWRAKATEDHSAFAGQVTCYNCGKPGHIAKDCPEKANSPGGHGGRGWGGGQGGRGRTGRGGCGRGGRGNRVDKDRQPPKPGESHTRTKNGRNEKWCGVHGYWTWGDIAHETRDCPTRTQSAQQATSGNHSSPSNTQGGGGNTTTGSQSSGSAMISLVTHAADF